MWKYAIWWVRWLSEFKYLVNITWTDMGGTHKSRHTGMAAQWVTFCTKNPLIWVPFWSQKKSLKEGPISQKLRKTSVVFQVENPWKWVQICKNFVNSCFLREKNYRCGDGFLDFGLHTLSKNNPPVSPRGGGGADRGISSYTVLFTLEVYHFQVSWPSDYDLGNHHLLSGLWLYYGSF